MNNMDCKCNKCQSCYTKGLHRRNKITMFLLLFTVLPFLVAAVTTLIGVTQIKSTGATAHQVIASDGSGKCVFETPTSTAFSGDVDTTTNKALSNSAGPVLITSNTSITSNLSVPTLLVNTINASTANGPLLITANPSITSAASVPTLFTDKISSKTVDSPISITQNISASTESFSNTLFTDTLNPKTMGGSINVIGGTLKNNTVNVVLETRTLTGGTGISAIGDLSADRTITLADTVVTPGSYTASNITVDQQGRITSAASGSFVPTTRTLTGGTGISTIGDLSANRTITLADTAVTPGSYTLSSITVDQQGRLTSASSGTTNVSVTSQLTSPTIFTDAINVKTDAGSLTMPANVSNTNVTIGTRLFVDTVNPKTIGGPVTFTNGVSGTQISSAIAFHDTLNPKTANGAISTTNVSTSNGLTSVNQLYVDNILPKTDSGTLTIGGPNLTTTNVSTSAALTAGTVLFVDTIKPKTDGGSINIAGGSLLNNSTAVVLSNRTLTGGTGINTIGDLSANRTISLADTAVSPATYTVATITVDQQGRITSASNGSASSFSGDVNTTTNKLLSDAGNVITGPDYGTVMIVDDQGLSITHGDATGGVTISVGPSGTGNVTGNWNVTSNATDTIHFTDTITTKSGGPNPAVTVTSNVSGSKNLTVATTLFTDNINVKTDSGVLTMPANVSNTNITLGARLFVDTVNPKTVGGTVTFTNGVSTTSETLSSTLFTDKISSKTVSTPIAVTSNTSVTGNALSVATLYADTLTSKTVNTSITIPLNGTGGVDMGNSRLKLAHFAGGNDANMSIALRTNGSWGSLPVGTNGMSLNITPSGTVSWAQPPMSSVSGGYVTRSSTNLLFAPAKSNRVYCYESSTWIERQIPAAGITVACTGLSASTDYYLYVYDSSGTLTLDLSTTSTVQQDGLPVKSGTTSRTFIARCRTNGSGAITTYAEDTSTQLVNNVYNKRNVVIYKTDTTNTWTATNPPRAANGSSANAVQYVSDGYSFINCSVYVMIKGTTSGGSGPGIGVDSTTVDSSIIRTGIAATTVSLDSQCSAHYTGILSAGNHTLTWMDNTTIGTGTYYGDNGTVQHQAGIWLWGNF